MSMVIALKQVRANAELCTEQVNVCNCVVHANVWATFLIKIK